MSLSKLINHCFNYVIQTSKIYNIDESHSLKHSMEVYKYSNIILDNEIINNPYLENQKHIIFSAAIGHDMCDKKYMDEKVGIENYKCYLKNHMNENDLYIMGRIIETMSYSKVKVNGFPNDMSDYSLAYHIVRESDLLASYDLDRCIIYAMHKNNEDYTTAVNNALKLFDNRIFLMRSDNLFITDYSKKESFKLHNQALNDIEVIKKNL
jgi:hypothetical protein